MTQGNFGRSRETPRGVLKGTQAYTVQSFVEANAKNGTGFEGAALFQNIAVGSSTNTILRTGPEPTILKAREIQFTGVSITARVFEGPTFQNEVSVGNLRSQTRINPGVSQAEFFSIPTPADVLATGEEVFAPAYQLGSEGQGNRPLSTFRLPGAEYILAPNTDYLLRIENQDPTDPINITSYVVIYEGPLSGDIG